jgi:hypothetical protein
MHIRRQLAAMTQVSLPPSLSRAPFSLSLFRALALSRGAAHVVLRLLLGSWVGAMLNV